MQRVMCNKRNWIGWFMLFMVYLGPAHSQTVRQLHHLDRYYAEALENWNVPGMAVALVKHDSIIFQKGYGLANLENSSPVDPNTLFAVASNTKPFTAAAIAQLVEQGRLDWKDKVRDHLPWFSLSDAWVSREMTIEDLLSHRSGLKTFSGDLLWFGTDKSPEQVVRAAQWLPLTQEFRADYGYSNILYIAAGLLIETVTDTSYSDYIHHHFLQPLGMDRTLTTVTGIEKQPNSATPYFLEGGNNLPLEWLNWDNAAAAGGLISSANDMAKWLQLNIHRGTLNGQEYFRESSFEKMTTPHIYQPINRYTRENQPSKHFRGYGLGWSLHDYHGRKIVSHGGGYDGMISKTCIVPEDGLGIVILTNSLNYLPGALVEKTLDVLLAKDTTGTDYAQLYLKAFLHNQAEKEGIERSFEETRHSIDPGHGSLEGYTGIYRDKMYGDVKVSLVNDQLVFNMIPTPIFTAKLVPWNHHVFTFRFDTAKSSLPPGKLWFQTDKDGKPNILLIEIDNPDFDFREFKFVKVPCKD
jgi:CubicO group peptidase (beta-lactamase class C family)